MQHHESDGNDDASSWDSEVGQPMCVPSQTPTKDDLSVISTQTGSTGNNLADLGVSLGIVRSTSDKKRKKKSSNNSYSPYSIQYKGVNIYQAAEQGSLPLCVLLWGMASAKRVNLLVPDAQGNNPLHAAALADSAEIVGFLLQQTKGDDVKLIETRNLTGETPLLRAMNNGVMSVARALIEGGSDPLVTDSLGNSIFTKLAKSGHVWCLNFMYHTICNMHGTQVALELMSTLDNEAHSPLDWAADSGDVNVIEFFIRKGLNPFRADSLNRTPLYWAVKSNRVEATRFLVLCGCDPFQSDTFGQSPMSIAKANGNQAMLAALSKKAPVVVSLGEASKSIQCLDPSKMPVLSLKVGKQVKSHAVYQHNVSDFTTALWIALLCVCVWLGTVFLPFYAWFALMAVLIYIYRKAESENKAISSNIEKSWIANSAILAKFLGSSEKGIGFWMGTMPMFAVYILSSFFYCTNHKNVNAVSSYSTFSEVSYQNIFHIGGISGAEGYIWLVFVTMGLFLVSMFLWVILVWFQLDPGIINTRDHDFEEVLAQSLLSSGPPPSSTYCRTTLVKKPLRSKYCTKTGAVVARMDHYCVWLNITVGFGNHRSFFIFLLSHLILCAMGVILTIRGLYLDITGANSCDVLPTLLSRKYFFTLMLSAVLIASLVGLGALTYEQSMNILNNMTTNEKLNGARYQWINNNDGFSNNRFDRGPVSNVLEFWQVPGYYIDYSKTFELPSDLTQENMQLNTSKMHSLRSHGLVSSQSTGQLHSGPPSIDLEMTVKNRADSVDSSENSLGLELV